MKRTDTNPDAINPDAINPDAINPPTQDPIAMPLHRPAHPPTPNQRSLTMSATDTLTYPPSKSSRRPKAGGATWALALGLVAAACAPEMDPASRIERTRVIGARVEVAGDPGRASPRPGQAATVTWLVTAPAEMPPLGWAFLVCPARSASLYCDGDPLAVFQGTQGPPMIELQVPEATALGEATELRLFGRICISSQPTFDGPSGRPTCTDAGDGTTAALSIPLAQGGEGNHNPSLAQTSISLDGQPWPSSESETCDDLPKIAADTLEHRIAFGTTAADRERYTGLTGDPATPVERREWLQISQFTTAGELERQFSTVEAEAPDDQGQVEVKWDAPKADEVSETGLLAHFTFVARDPRGGSDWLTRALCVTRP